jgi:CRISP-associated protein Cas1
MQLVVDDYGMFVGLKSERAQVRKGKATVQEAPLFDLEQVVLSGSGISISADLVEACAERGIPIFFMTSLGRPTAMLVSAGLAGTVRTRREQLLAYTDGRGVALAKAFARGKCLNQATLLKYMAKYRKSKDLVVYRQARDAAIEIEILADEVTRLEGVRVDDIRPSLLNREGRAAQFYWDAIGAMLRADLPWVGREHRGAVDPVNSALNYGYGMLYNQVQHALLLAGLDPYAGFVHVDRPGKPSLVLDAIEEFRQPIVDRTVFGLLNKGVERPAGCWPSGYGRGRTARSAMRAKSIRLRRSWRRKPVIWRPSCAVIERCMSRFWRGGEGGEGEHAVFGDV